MAPRQISEKQIDTQIAELHDLAYNLWWSWNPSAQQLFHELSPFFWEHSNHNPVEVIKWISGQELRERLRNQDYFRRVAGVSRNFRAYLNNASTWARKHVPGIVRTPVAYFSAEFGLHESLRIYSGGLGILAGDHAKSASDIGVSFVGITLIYRQGYFQQQINNEGWQTERYPTYEPGKMPIRPVLDRKGNPVICSVEIGQDLVSFRGWEVKVGRARVFLLDTDLPQNDQRIRDLTAHVYGGDQWNRIGQEILLGIGGIRFLRTIGIAPAVFHMNEGHSAFLTLELLREQLHSTRQPKRDEVSLRNAEKFVRDRCVFTTHTPVPAGHDRFDSGLMNAAFPRYSASLGMPLDQIMRYGRVHPENTAEPFTMTVLALRMCRAANGVSELHGKISREMWRDLYPSIPLEKIPIGSVTNGVHTAGWTAPTAMTFWSGRLGPNWIDKVRDNKFWHKSIEARKISDADLWALRTALRRELVEFSRRRLREQQMRYNANDISLFDNVLSPDALTIGFARRFATYKRAPLFFRDFAWALRILTNQEKPLQLIFSGKAHPRDDAGKHFIQEVVNITKRVDLFGKVIFLEDYDINVARHLVAGADVWLNTPRRPMEASGTSGMKIAIHGGLHLSTMDGWWREAFDGSNGWSIGEDSTQPSEEQQDDKDAASLRGVLESDVIPLFYDRGKDGIPHGWLKRVRHAMATLIPVYNTHRMVEEYAQKYYAPGEQKKT